MPKITMTQWWEKLEGNLHSLSKKLDPATRDNLMNSVPWNTAMSMAKKGKVIEEKGLMFAVTNGTAVERDMKKLSESLGVEGLPNVTDNTSLLFALCYSDYMPFYPTIESSVPFITGFLQSQANTELVAKRTKIIQARILTYYEANKESVEAIPGIRQMPGVSLLKLPPEKKVAVSVNREIHESGIEALEKQLSEQKLKIESATQNKVGIQENLDVINTFIASLKNDNSKNIEKIIEQNPKALKLIEDEYNTAATNSDERNTIDLIYTQLRELNPKYFSRSFLDVFPRFMTGPTYNETKSLLIKTLENEYSSPKIQALSNAEEAIKLETAELNSIQSKIDEQHLIQKQRAATYLKDNYFTLKSETPDLIEMKRFSERLNQLIIGLDTMIEVKNHEIKGEKVPKALVKKILTNLDPDSPDITHFLSAQSNETLLQLKNDAINGKKVVDSYCETYTETQKLNTSPEILGVMHYLAITYPLFKRLLEVLPDRIAATTLNAIKETDENSKKMEALNAELAAKLVEINSISQGNSPNNGATAATDSKSTPPVGDKIGQTKDGFFNKDKSTDKEVKGPEPIVQPQNLAK